MISVDAGATLEVAADRQIEAVEPTGGLVQADCETYDGFSPLHIELDHLGSVLWYLPSFAIDDRGNQAASVFELLDATLLRVSADVPPPPKDSSSSNGRAQYYGVGSYASPNDAFVANSVAHPDVDKQSAPSAVKDQTLHHVQEVPLRANPRWCQAARPLAGDDFASIRQVMYAVEREVLLLLCGRGRLVQPWMEVVGVGEQIRLPLFNSVLVNRYADGSSQIKWHADDEHCYGPAEATLIASVSLGASRYFEIRKKPRRGDQDRSAQQRKRFILQPGSLLIMGGPMQAEWQHSVPADDACQDARINLTFRKIVGDKRRHET